MISIIWLKVYVKRLKRAKGRRDVKAIGRIRSQKPTYRLDHIVKERYPTFTDALKDLDDCLSLIFLFSILPKSKRVYVERVHLCRRLACKFTKFMENLLIWYIFLFVKWNSCIMWSHPSLFANVSFPSKVITFKLTLKDKRSLGSCPTNLLIKHQMMLIFESCQLLLNFIQSC